MAKTGAIGDGPIVFFTDAGGQVQVPLSDIFFNNGVVGTSRTDLSSPRFDNWIKFLASRGRIVASDTPQPVRVLDVTATDPGRSGNNIQLTVTPTLDSSRVDVTVTETDRYPGLTLETIAVLLGVKNGVSGTAPGLLRCATDPTASVSPAPKMAPVDIHKPVASAYTAAELTIEGGGKKVTLEPRRSSVDFDTGERRLTVSDLQPPTDATVFTLTFTWTKTIPNLLKADIPSKLAPLGYLVAFKADGGASVSKLPVPGTVKLSGGTPDVVAQKASASVLADA
jgi:hypothetical protein